KKKLIIIGYIIAILFGWGNFIISLLFRSFGFYGFFGFFGLFFPGFMLNSKDQYLRKHGIIQLLITLFGILFTVFFLFK
ncbi:MAG: zinc ribbon domain-containing protein, partial [Methanobacteriaceae archaeon]|nr:zinc ribbon domain-containing protein [Methanobacteriaceae archaeon]